MDATHALPPASPESPVDGKPSSFGDVAKKSRRRMVSFRDAVDENEAKSPSAVSAPEPILVELPTGKEPALSSPKFAPEGPRLQLPTGGSPFAMPPMGAGLRSRGRSKSANVSALLEALGDDDDDGQGDNVRFQKGGPMMTSRKGFYAPKSQAQSPGGEMLSEAAPSLQSSSSNKGFYKGNGVAGERKIAWSREASLRTLSSEATAAAAITHNDAVHSEEADWGDSSRVYERSKSFKEGNSGGLGGNRTPIKANKEDGFRQPQLTTSANNLVTARKIQSLDRVLTSPRGAETPLSWPKSNIVSGNANAKKGYQRTSSFGKKSGVNFLMKSGLPRDDLTTEELKEQYGGDRFNLLLLEEGEYYFKDFPCLYSPREGDPRSMGTLKMCSDCLFFSPLDEDQPVVRIRYVNVQALERGPKTVSEDGESEEVFVVKCSEMTDVSIGRRGGAHVQRKGPFSCFFVLPYTTVSAVLPKIQKLLDLAQDPPEDKAARLQALITKHEEELNFNVAWFETSNESLLLQVNAFRMSPLVVQPGRVVLTNKNIYFQPFNVVSACPVAHFPLKHIKWIRQRNVIFEETGVELYFSEWESVSLVFKSVEDCTHFFRETKEQPDLMAQQEKTLQEWQRAWVNNEVSNKDYLMYLNREAGRSFNDLSQYPIFPWVIADFESSTLDLTKSETFRDLTRPIGALNAERLEGLRLRYGEMAEAYEDWCESLAPDPPPAHVPGLPSPPYLYGCHFSTPGYVAFYRVRDQPQLMLRLQNGKYDMPDRLFSSIPELWESVSSQSSDLKELIPEFYSSDPSFLLNASGLDLGSKQSGEQVGDVVLPPWASDVHDFLEKMQQALEAPSVSRKLQKWINLVFGCKQRGAAAMEADNLFHPLTYPEHVAAALEALRGEEDGPVRDAIRAQMQEFGRMPKQLFDTLHPRKKP
eukprot:TRINITY_DN6725_c0_g2_i1.p1 TRINITY_DN6725_c0_g2~~TRINITY_DN6725_c0_g2_i1.p1  ORF type:complete len:926 (+),score=154.21 TRINITY_DN6725_c0_g2_i1:58-2835(+)